MIFEDTSVKQAAADLHAAAVGEGGGGREIAIVRDAETAPVSFSEKSAEALVGPVRSVRFAMPDRSA